MRAAIFLVVFVAVMAVDATVSFNETNWINDARNGVMAEMWFDGVQRGISAFHPSPAGYQVYRNVKDFGCRGDGVTDDTVCINSAISSGGRCGYGCGSSTVTPALIYFPSGSYVVSSPIVMYYYSQLVGNANDRPRIIAAPNFAGMAVFDSNPYDGTGNNWFTNQNNFFRQVRNFIIDTTRTPAASTTTGIHWQVAQATSLVNIEFVMSTQAGNAHQGIWMENGSGGFMSDLKFTGGRFGMWVGNQQFLSLDLEFNQCDTAIYMNWNWQWTFKNIRIANSRIGIDMSAEGNGISSGVGSILLMDSSITNTQVGIRIRNNPPPNRNDVSGTLLLDNVQVLGVGTVVQNIDGGVVLQHNGVIPAWGRGSRYQDASGVGTYVTGPLPIITKSANLLDSQGRFFRRTRPQYESLPASYFDSVKHRGATGNGVSDDSDAVQATINANVNTGRIVYFPAGTYVFYKTVTVPPGVRIIGEAWSVIMAGGNSFFQDQMNPRPVLQVGIPGQQGNVEISDLMFATKGAQPGAILVQWNIRQGSQGGAGMWDSHFRVGGTTGSNLQVPQCPKGQGAVRHCEGAHTLLHVTATGSGYFENVWAWTADHDLDNHVAQGQISIYTGRGVVVESVDGPVWLYGTQSEHNVFSQYQLTNARNVFMTMIQSETPYWQPAPRAPAPFTPNAVFSDPSYSHCTAADFRCPLSYALIAKRCSNVYLYGAGMYNFFNNYDQTCLLTEDCQRNMVSLANNSAFYMYNINTKASINMVIFDNDRPLAVAADNRNGFCHTVNAFTAQV
ncbi:probable glucan endo-1,3-beta-glucosidase ARB_02077 [Bradysia coprophila]|uniref:probable glucan endo-1,3-beta-glucosidase ARB_02077 n=1 Tax=Bradysia coprophila TaxID=38358 RepID=UPI00187D8AFB|nr:probable glucan endo-1,3-beta-glucosidase ARB_02077 [Bradysia coprophila]